MDSLPKVLLEELLKIPWGISASESDDFFNEDEDKCVIFSEF